MSDVLDSLGQVFTRDFWGRVLTRPWDAMIAMPGLAARSAVVAGGAALAVGAAIKAAPVLLAAAKPVTWAARHPILTYAALTNPDLPSEIVRAFGSSVRVDVTFGGGRALPVPPAPAPVRGIPARHDAWRRMFPVGNLYLRGA